MFTTADYEGGTVPARSSMGGIDVLTYSAVR